MSAPAVFERPHKVRFGECDPAGIVFYPRYYDMAHEVVEDFFDSLGFDYKTLHMQDNKGLPTVHMEADFLKTSTLGDELSLTLQVIKIGTTSLSLRIKGASEGQERFTMDSVLVYIDLKSMEAEPLPATMQAKVQNYLGAEEK